MTWLLPGNPSHPVSRNLLWYPGPLFGRYITIYVYWFVCYLLHYPTSFVFLRLCPRSYSPVRQPSPYQVPTPSVTSPLVYSPLSTDPSHTSTLWGCLTLPTPTLTFKTWHIPARTTCHSGVFYGKQAVTKYHYNYSDFLQLRLGPSGRHVNHTRGV